MKPDVSNEDQPNDLANEVMSQVAIFRGPYGKLARMMNDLENNLPSDVKIVYRRVHPGRFVVSLAGSE